MTNDWWADPETAGVSTGIGSEEMVTPSERRTLDEGGPENGPVLRLAGSRVTLADRVYLQIRNALMSGQFMPGQTLTIDLLSKQFGVSHMPVREALRRLSAVEALEVAQNGSARVPLISIERLSDICTNRLHIESHAAALAAGKNDAVSLAKLTGIAEAHEDCRQNNEVYRMLELNQHLHFGIYALAGSPIMMQIIENLWLRHGPYMRLLTDDLVKQIGPNSNLEVGPGHKMLMASLKAGDAAGAATALKSDILGPYDMLRELCREYIQAELDRS
ncbi:MAG: GntR family transcriptional regulator [Hyphomicrobiales bacterium]